jgi:hypothetical protein
MWYVDAYPFHRNSGGGLSGLEEFSPYYESSKSMESDINKRIKLLEKRGMCVLFADKDNPPEVMDRIPLNFPYIIIFDTQSNSERSRLISYGESMWDGWCEYYNGRKVPVWDDIKPKPEDDGYRWQAEREMANGYNLDADYSGNSITLPFVRGSKNSVVDKWGPALDSTRNSSDVNKPEQPRTKLNMGFMVE